MRTQSGLASACMFRPSAPPPGRTLSVGHTEGSKVHQGVEQAGDTKTTCDSMFFCHSVFTKICFSWGFSTVKV